ncbi:hypothetical protein C5167_034248 [Papaver somniferum]|uniref:Uncharacterized protein n=1 Tax=Papaver somniferum TaxID=3469 RepID=A0A4Y7KFB3_PAPSO|nr:hypothetical protein C5167_034248 [Papaver somniferum]
MMNLRPGMLICEGKDVVLLGVCGDEFFLFAQRSPSVKAENMNLRISLSVCASARLSTTQRSTYGARESLPLPTSHLYEVTEQFKAQLQPDKVWHTLHKAQVNIGTGSGHASWRGLFCRCSCTRIIRLRVAVTTFQVSNNGNVVSDPVCKVLHHLGQDENSSSSYDHPLKTTIICCILITHCKRLISLRFKPVGMCVNIEYEKYQIELLDIK